MAHVPETALRFLKKLKENNNREWMTENRQEYLANEKALKDLYASIEEQLNTVDEIEKLKIFRIHRDVRFSKNKTPYNVHRSAGFSRSGASKRGGYYLRIEPNGKSMLGGGFFGPEPADLKRIREEFKMDASEIRDILNESRFKKIYGSAFETRDAVKTAPKGFSKDDPNIDLIRQKSFVVTRTFSDAEVTAPGFDEIVFENFKLLRPFFDYMSDVLTTDVNGVSLIDY